MRFIFLFLKNILFSFRFRVNDQVDIIVNGPSLDNDLVNYTKNGKLLVVNQFVRHKKFDELRPEFYLIQDPYFWREDVLDHWKEKRDLTFKFLEEKVDWTMILILPKSARRHIKINNQNIRLRFFNDVNREFRFWQKNSYSLAFRFLLNHNKISPVPRNVLVTAVYLLILANVPIIRIFGANMSFFKTLEVNDETNQVGIVENHFYGKEFFEVFKSKSFQERTSLSHELLKWSYVFRELEKLNNFAQLKNIKIINNTSKSYIDAFDRE